MCSTISVRRIARSSLCDSAGELHLLLPRTPKCGSPRRPRQQHSQTLEARQTVVRCSAARGSTGQRLPSWDNLTQRLVTLSSLPFLFLLLPQLLKNAASLSSNPEALGILSYVSYLTGLFGNTLLLSYFTTKAEHSAVLVQAIGIASSFAVLTQIRIAGFMPRTVYATYGATATIVACTATLTALKLSGRLDASKQGQRIWAAWQKVLGLAGLAVVPQVLWTTLVGTPTLLPSLCTFGLGCVMLVLSAAGRLPPAVESAWSGLSAGTATLLFVLQPVAQLIKNFQDPASLSGLSLATIQLAACGNALMVPRALFTRDLIWLVGSSWGSLVFGWAQALSLWLGTNPATGGRYLGTPLFAGCSALLWSWFAFVAWMDARAKRGAAEAQAAGPDPAK